MSRTGSIMIWAMVLVQGISLCACRLHDLVQPHGQAAGVVAVMHDSDDHATGDGLRGCASHQIAKPRLIPAAIDRCVVLPSLDSLSPPPPAPGRLPVGATANGPAPSHPTVGAALPLLI